MQQKGASWRLVLTGGQHYNGQAERVIGMLKLCLAQSWRMEMTTLMSEAAQVVNSRPIAWGKPAEDPSNRGPITPLHLCTAG